MKMSQLFTKTMRSSPADEVAKNAELLTRAGFIYKNSAGVYSFLPLGWRVMQKIASIIREEMNAIGGQEMLMPALVDKKYLDATGRWSVAIGFEVRGKQEKDAVFSLGWTHEEVLTAIASHYISSYKDLPFAAYQIQTKFRNEPRAKSGLLRGREFIMKDLYSFHASEEDFQEYYAIVAKSYHTIFERCGLKAIYTLAAGGDFTAANTHEFQVLASVGEDTIYVCASCAYAENAEISKLQNSAECPQCAGEMQEKTSIEVGNIFPLGAKYSEAFNLRFADERGGKQPVIMGSYGIGLGRVMATVVEVLGDEKGIRWPHEIAPFHAHLILLDGQEKEAEDIYTNLCKAGVEVLYDDRQDRSAGEKFADADLIGVPLRIVVSKRTLEKKAVEVKKRESEKIDLVTISEVADYINNEFL